MIGKWLKGPDFRYVATFGEFWMALPAVSAAAFLLGLIVG